MTAVPGDGVNVTDVAQRWGFTHLRNFSGHVPPGFGESPWQTLRRRASGRDTSDGERADA